MDKISIYRELKNSWNKSIKLLGETKPSDGGHTSIFLYPYNCKIIKNNNYFVNALKKNGWIYQTKEISDFHKISKITDYLKESLFSDKNMIFSKTLDIEYELWVDGEHKSNFKIDNIEFILFNDDILIFSIFTSSKDIIQNISSILNREMRNPSCIYFDNINGRFLSFDYTMTDVEELKQKYCKQNKVIIIPFGEYIKNLLSDKNIIEIKELQSGKSKYAKYITSIHCNINNELEDKLTYSYPELQHETDVSFNILHLCVNNMSTSNDFIVASKKFEQDIDYTRNCIKNYGIRLWSMWGGVASLNSLAFLSINDGGRSIVHQCNNEIYIIYLINIYIKLKLQSLDKNIIDENFMQISKSRLNLENLFKLKAKYFSEEIADSFQPILIDKKIKAALGIDNLLKNIQENIVKTNEIVKDNNSSAFAVIVAIYVSINEIIPLLTDSKVIKVFIIGFGIIGAFMLWKKRNKIGKTFDYFLK